MTKVYICDIVVKLKCNKNIVTTISEAFVIGSKSPKIREHNRSFKRKRPVYAHELAKIDPMKDLEAEWAKRMPK